MENHEKYFFFILFTNKVKFFASLDLTMKKFKTLGTPLKVFMALSFREGEDLNSYQNLALFDRYYSDDVALQMQNYFLQVFENEDQLVSYLNGKITYRHIRHPRTLESKEEKNKVNTSVLSIMNNHLEHLIDDDIF